MIEKLIAISREKVGRSVPFYAIEAGFWMELTFWGDAWTVEVNENNQYHGLYFQTEIENFLVIWLQDRGLN